MKDLTEQEIQQFEIVSELANTEDQYVKDLHIIIEVSFLRLNVVSSVFRFS